mgnify:CR=1 FL=1
MGEKKRNALLRYGTSGLFFSILGPGIFWICYPVGRLKALIIAELTVHVVRYWLFRSVVFPEQKGYRVSPTRYIVSIVPASAAAGAVVLLTVNVLDRAGTTLASALLALIVGFIWSRLVYSLGQRRT